MRNDLDSFTPVTSIGLIADPEELKILFFKSEGIGIGFRVKSGARLNTIFQREVPVSQNLQAINGSEADEPIGVARYTPAGREDEILAVLKEAMDQLRLMMNALWELATVIDAGLNSKARADGEG